MFRINLETDLKKRRLVGIVVILIALIFFLSLNRFPKIDTINADLAVVSSPSSECFQGFCIDNPERKPFLERWWTFSITYLQNVSIGMLFAFVMAGLTEAFLFPPNVAERFTGTGMRGVFKGLIIGPIVNLCSACIVPIANGFRNRGASLETTVAITQSSSTLNLFALIMAVLVFSPLIGATRIVLSIIGVLLLGPLVAWIVKKGTTDSERADQNPVLAGLDRLPDDVSWSESISNASLQFVRATFIYFLKLGPIMVVAGFGSGLVIQWISPDTVTAWVGDDVLGILIASTLGILINVPLMFEIPLVAAMLLSGMGTAPAGALLFTAAAGGPITFWGLSKVMPLKGVATLTMGTWAFGVIGGTALLAFTSITEEDREFSFRADYSSQLPQAGTTLNLDSEANAIPVKTDASLERVFDVEPFENIGTTSDGDKFEIWNDRPGIVVFDYDRDNDQDIYITSERGHPNKLYENNGLGEFIDVAAKSGTAITHNHSTGAIACDIDNDGFQDLYVGSWGDPNDGLGFRSEQEGNVDSLLRNNGDGTFEDITHKAFGDSVNHRSATSIACGDLNNDGYVDFYVGNLLDEDFREFEYFHHAGHYNLLYENQKDLTFIERGFNLQVQGTEIDMVYPDGTPVKHTDKETSKEYQGYDPNLLDSNGNRIGEPTGQTHAVLLFDHDNDRDQDLWVANDGDRLRVYENISANGNLNFIEVGPKLHVDQMGSWMGFAVGDYDSDSDLDLFITNIGFHSLTQPLKEDPRGTCDYFTRFAWGTCLHMLLTNEGAGVFRDLASDTEVEPSPWVPPISLVAENLHDDHEQPTGLAAYDFGFGTTFFDFDNDTDQDLYWLGSTLARGEAPMGGIFPSAGRMLRNNGDGTFQDITVQSQLLDIINVDYEELKEKFYARGNIQFLRSKRISRRFHENGKGVAHGDLNGDGFVDLIGTNSSGEIFTGPYDPSINKAPTELSAGPTFIWMNAGGTNNWVNIRLIGRMSIDGTGSNADGIGAKVYLTSKGINDKNSVTQVQEVRAGSSYLSMDSLNLEFGLGTADVIEKILILWPSGTEQILENASINQLLEIKEPELCECN